jgi:hypothetical protein
MLDKLPNEYYYYKFWPLWLFVAGLKTWKDAGIRAAFCIYWNFDALKDWS